MMAVNAYPCRSLVLEILGLWLRTDDEQSVQDGLGKVKALDLVLLATVFAPRLKRLRFQSQEARRTI